MQFHIGLPGMVLDTPVYTKSEFEVPDGYKKILVTNSEPLGP